MNRFQNYLGISFVSFYFDISFVITKKEKGNKLVPYIRFRKIYLLLLFYFAMHIKIYLIFTEALKDIQIWLVGTARSYIILAHRIFPFDRCIAEQNETKCMKTKRIRARCKNHDFKKVRKKERERRAKNM